LSARAPVAVDQRRQHRRHRVIRVAAEVGIERPQAEGWVLGEAGDAVDPGERVDVRADAAPAPPLPGRLEDRHVDEDQVRPDRDQIVKTKTPAIEPVAREIGGDHIRDRCQPPRQRLPLPKVEVE
jgi:hypothetical protein